MARGRPSSTVPPGAPLDITARRRAAQAGAPGFGGGFDAGYAPDVGPGVPGIGGGARPANPDWIPPPGATDFLVTTQPILNVAGPGTTALLAEFTVPANRVAVIRDLEVAIANMVLGTRVRFAVLASGTPIAGWSEIWVAPRPAAFVSRSFFPDSTVLRIPAQATIQLQGTVVDGGAYDLSMIAHGWHYPEALRNAFDQGV